MMVPQLLDDEITGEKSWVILQSLLCLLREKNLLNRADIEELCDKVKARAAMATPHPLACRQEGLTRAVDDMMVLGSYIGTKYGGKRRRPQ